MTVREAFNNSGYPVPSDFEIFHSDGTWYAGSLDGKSVATAKAAFSDSDHQEFCGWKECEKTKTTLVPLTDMPIQTIKRFLPKAVLNALVQK